LYNKDSIATNDSLMTQTLVTKRKVFSGGGIMPDLFVPLDTSVHYGYFNTLVRKNIYTPYVVSYIDKNRKDLLKKYPDFKVFKNNFKVPPVMLDELMTLGEKAGIKKDEESVRSIQDVIFRQIRALIARDLFEPGDYFKVMIEDDKEVQKAMELFADPKSYNRLLNR
jgi:carboxyl-terminal processing protease